MDTINLLPSGIFVTPLKQVPSVKGDIFHALKLTDQGFHGFGEAYFTHILAGETKGWKQHTKMVLNLIVPVGTVRFHFYNEAESKASNVLLSSRPEEYMRLTVAPGNWLAFSGVGPDTNLILNLASIEHDPTEAINCDLTKWPLSSSQNLRTT